MTEALFSKVIDYKNVRPCSCRIKGKEYFCFKKAKDSACMVERSNQFEELLSGLEKEFNHIKDKMITETRNRLKGNGKRRRI